MFTDSIFEANEEQDLLNREKIKKLFTNKKSVAI